MPRFKKGTKEAKEYMAKIRKLRGKPLKFTEKLIKTKSKSIIVKKLGKKSKSHQKRSFTLPMAPIIGVIAMPDVQEIAKYAMNRDFGAVIRSVPRLIGIEDGQFNANLFFNNMIPLGLGVGTHWLASKFGLNRMIARAGIPIIRI